MEQTFFAASAALRVGGLVDHVVLNFQTMQ